MNLKTKKRATITTITLLLLLTPIAGYAALEPPVSQVPQDPVVAKVGSFTLAGGVITTIVGWVVGVFWVVVVAFAVLAAFNYLTAQGSEEKITKAKQMVVYTLIAAAVALLGTGLRAIVTNLLTAT
jgi:hypothetical protein